MRLEDIIRRYGAKADYMDHITGNIFHLPTISKADDRGNRTIQVTMNDGRRGIVTVNGIMEEDL